MEYFALIVILFVFPAPCQAQKTNRPFAAEEKVLTEALAVRIKMFEQETKIDFPGKPKILVQKLPIYEDGSYVIARYEAKSGNILFSPDVCSTLNLFLGQLLKDATGAEVASHQQFYLYADHELGHYLADQLSRKAGNGPYYLHEKFDGLGSDEQLGLKFVAEGIGEWFGRRLNLNDTEWASKPLPELKKFRDEDQLGFVYGNGYWTVKGVIDRYGGKGIVWLVSHQLSLRKESIQADADAYLDRALTELARSSSKRKR